MSDTCVSDNVPVSEVYGPAGVRSVLEPFFAPTLENEFVILREVADGPVVLMERRLTRGASRRTRPRSTVGLRIMPSPPSRCRALQRSLWRRHSIYPRKLTTTGGGSIDVAMRYDPPRSAERHPGASSDSSGGIPDVEVGLLRDPLATSPALVGRFDEIAWLDARVREALTAGPRLVLLEGDAGIGKTRILSATAELARSAGFHVGVGRARDGESGTLLAVFEAIRSLVREATPVEEALDSPVWSELARLAAGAQGTSKKISGTSTEPPFHLVLAEALVGVAREEPVALLLDDMHWADAATLAVLESLVFLAMETAVRTPLALLLVAALRPEPPNTGVRSVARLEREAACAKLEVGGLDEEGLRALLAENGVLHPSQQLIGVLVRETKGNPLYAQQVLHHLLDSKALVDRHGSLVLADASLKIPIPADLQAAVSERLDKIQGVTREILRIASLLGDTFHPCSSCG